MIYEVYLDGETLYYPGDKLCVITNDVLTQELNDSGTFEFDVPIENPLYSKIQNCKSMIQILKDGNEIFYGEVREAEVEIDFVKHVCAIGELSFLFDSIQPQARYQDNTPVQFFKTLLDIHNSQVEEKKQFQLGIVTVTDPNDSIYRFTNYEDTLTAMRKKLCDSLDGYLRVRKENGIRYLDLVKLEDYGKRCLQPVEFGVNLLEYAEKSSGVNIHTAVIPLGARLEQSVVEGLDAYVTIESVNNGVDYVYNEEAVKQFGWKKTTHKWEDVTLPVNLKRKAEEWLKSTQFESLTLNVNAVDLSMLNSDIEAFEMGDQLHALAQPFGMDTWFPVRKKTTYLQDLAQNYIVLSNTAQKGYTQQVAEQVNRLENEIPQQASLLELSKKNASGIIETATHGFVFLVNDEDGNPKELLIMDTKDIETARKVWRWNVNGLGYSSTGYYGEYGLAMTMDGTVNADFIKVGTMLANRIKGGTLNMGGFDNLNGVINIFDATGAQVGTIDNNGIAFFSNETQLQVIISPSVGIVQRDADGNEYYGYVFDNTIQLPRYSEYAKREIYTGVDEDTIQSEIIETKDYLYFKSRYWYEHSTAYWNAEPNVTYPQGYTSITLQLPERFKGKKWIVRLVYGGMVDKTGNEYKCRWSYGSLPYCKEGLTATDADYSYAGAIGDGYWTLLSMISTKQTPYLKYPDPSSGEYDIFYDIPDEISEYSFDYIEDTEKGTITITGKAMAGKYCVNELMNIRVLVSC